jgi:hypothetical protein
MTREDWNTVWTILGFVLGFGMAKLEKLFDRWEARARSRKATEER